MSCFITLEGIEGCGKSTLQQSLAEALAPTGREIILTREPGATWIGRAIREILLNPDNRSLSPLAELALFAADRAQHVTELIRPALDRGAIVISDRYTHSTLAYQGFGRGLPLEVLTQLNDLVTNALKPDLILLLDLDPKIGLKRARIRADLNNVVDFPTENNDAESGWNRFEEQELSFHNRVRDGFLNLSQDPQHNYTVIDASASPEQVKNEALAAVQNLLKENQS